MSVTGVVNRSEFSFRSQAGIPSGPEAFLGFSKDNFLKTAKEETTNGVGDELVGDSHGGSKLAGRGWRYSIGDRNVVLTVLAIFRLSELLHNC